MKHLIPKTMTVVPVMALALAVGGCGSSSDDEEMMPVEPTPAELQARCEMDGGRWEANGSCTSAAMLVEERATMQRTRISNAISAAQTAVNAVDNDSTDAEVSAADAAVMAARTAIANAGDVPADEKAANTGTVNALAMQLSGAKTARMNAMNEAEMAEREMRAAMAAKLYAGISAPMGTTLGTYAVTDRLAGYNADDTAIVVQIGDGGDTPATEPTATLSEDKDTMVADNQGWEGKRYADPAGGDMVEAYVYSNIGEPTEGKKFNVGYSLTGGRTATIDTSSGLAYDGGTPSATDTQARIALTGVTRTSGTETFELPDPNTTNEQYILVPGSFHGVSGTYRCDTGAGRDQACSASVATDGFTLTGTWTFAPTDDDAKVMDAPDADYASYGWWIRKAANDGPFTASAFHDFKGTAGAVDIATLVAGTAKYVGGAAGKYALASSTGGTNDAGHFTAMATLNAKFGATANTISGEITNFVGPDGGNTWTVELQEAALGNDGAITRAGDDQDNNDTVWTIGDMDAAASGEWSGNLREVGDDGVPKVATGTFYSEFGTAGKMVGAFGANKE